GIQHKIKPRFKNLPGIGFKKKRVDRMNKAIRIDGQDAPGHDFHLGLAQLTINSVKLAVDVADANVIQIHQRKLPNTRTRQRFHSPGSDTAQTDDANMSSPKSVQTRGSNKPANTAEARIIMIHSGCLLPPQSGFAKP